MGNHGSAQILEAHYAHLLGKHMQFRDDSATNEAKVGGAVVGGYSALEDYGNSVYSSAKEELIRGIASDVLTSLQVKTEFVKSAPIGELIAKFKRFLPDPKNKKNLRSDAGTHKAICAKLASSINKRYGVVIIDENAEAGVICQKVSEIMYSLFTGLHTEFLSIAGDVSRIVKNLQILKEYIDSANNKLIQDLQNSTDLTISSDAENVKALYGKLSSEIDRQHAILTNLTNSVIGPLGKSLITLLEDNNDFAGLTEDLKKMVGTPVFGERLGYLLSGTSDIAHAAHLVDKALKNIGMSVKDYKNVKNLRELRDKVYQTMINRKPNSNELHKMLVAADVLYRNDMAHNDIAEFLEKKKGGLVDEIRDPSFADMVDDATWTDTSTTPFKGRVQSYRKSVGKQIKEQARYRNMLFADFNKQIRDHYQKIIYNLEKLSKKIGIDIEPSIELEHFIRLLNSFAASQPNKHNLHLALSSYYTDSQSSYTKYQYMSHLVTLAEEAQSLAGRGDLFKQIAQSINALIKVIDDFNINFTKTLTESHVNIAQPRPRMGGGRKGKKSKKPHSNNVEDVDEFDLRSEEHEAEEHEAEEHEAEEHEAEEHEAEEHSVVGGMEHILGGIIAGYDDHEFKHFVTLKRVIRGMDYYYKIAHIKKNLAKVAVENEANVVNYENILGEEAGYLIDQIQKKYNALLADANGQPMLSEYGYTKYEDLFRQGRTTATKNEKSLKDLCGDELKDELSGYKFLIEYIRGAKVEMLEAAQALDLYLSKFTHDVEMKPDIIQNFAQIVEQLEVVAKWFNDKSGDNFAEVFESFSSVDEDYELMDVNDADSAKKHNAEAKAPLNSSLIIKEHYYQIFEDETTKPGKFYNPRLMKRDDAITFVKRLEKSIKSVRALENLVNIFTKLNAHSRDGVKTFMSPASMFKAFMKYCVAASLSVGFKVLENSSPAVDHRESSSSSKEHLKSGESELKDSLETEDAAKTTSLEVKEEIIASPTTSTTGGATVEDNYPHDDDEISKFDSPIKIAFAKMAVGLRFSEQYVKLKDQKFLHLCDPLEVDEELKKKNGSNCDKIFEMCIKSMIAKIFTVVGSYSLFNRPPKKISTSDAMPTSALRQIMGGGPDYVKVVPEAAELYLRLPLLVEWYRTVFEFSKDLNKENGETFTKQNDPIVSIVPEMDNIWGTLCKVIFIDGRNIQDGTYPSEYARKIIQSITEIYTHYSQKKKGITCREIIEEFVIEINRRYGFMMRDEINDYLKERELNYKNISYDEEDVMDYDLLDVNNQFGRGAAPSDRFRTFATKNAAGREISFRQFNNAVKRFRHSIEHNLMLGSVGGGSGPLGPKDLEFNNDTSVAEVIDLTKKRLRGATTDEDKYRIIHEQLHGVEKFGELDQNKLLAFHETVISPLTILYFTYLIVNNYNRFMVSLNMEKYGSGNIGTDLAKLLIANKENFKNDTFKDNKEAILDYISDYSMDAAKNYENIYGISYSSTNDSFTKRFSLNRSKLMEDTLRHVMNIACEMNNLVDVSYSGQGQKRYPIVNFDKLENVCEALFQSVKTSISKLRKSVPASLIESVEKAKLDDKDNVVSLFWIQENLFDRLFKNKFGNGLSDANNGLKSIWLELTKKHDYGFKDRASSAVDDEHRYDSYNDVFSKLAFWDVTRKENIVENSLGLRSLTMTDELQQFPAHYISIYRSGGTFGNTKTKEEKELNNTLMMTENIGDGKKSLYLNEKIVTPVLRNNTDSNNIRMDFFLGFHNLYDYNAEYDHKTELRGSESKSINELGGADKIAPCKESVVGGAEKTEDDGKEDDGKEGDGKEDDGKEGDVAKVSDSSSVSKVYLHDKLGLIPKLNNLIYNYVKMFLDPSSKKIYKPLLEKFVNGHNSKDVLQGKNINDRVIRGIEKANKNSNYVDSLDGTEDKLCNVVPAVCLLEPPEQATLFASLANTIKGIMTQTTERVSGNVPRYVEDNFANISEYQKELMRAYLPTFEKQLELIVKRADLMKNLLENTPCKVYKPKTHKTQATGTLDVSMYINQTAAENDSSYTQPMRVPHEEGEASRKTYLINMLTDVVVTAKSLCRCVQSVSKELADIPMFFETYKDSIIDYNNRNGHLPLMPLSSLTHLMNLNLHRVNHDGSHDYSLDTTNEDKTKYNLALLPQASRGVGSTAFKFAYGTRGVLSHLQKPNIDYVPGVTSLLEYAKLGGAARDISVADLVSNSIILSRFVTDYQYHHQYLDKQAYGVVRKLMYENRTNTGATEIKNLTCQTGCGKGDSEFWKRTENVVLLAENDNFRQAVYRMVACMQTSGGKLTGSERSDLRIYNILDLGCVPLNIHALQREIPFVNLMNYSYSFDNIIKESLGSAYKGQSLTDIHGLMPLKKDMKGEYVQELGEMTYSDDDYKNLTHPEDALVRHLIYPNGFRRLCEYNIFTRSLMCGDTTLGLNRPKFLSDQLWNKVLLNSVWDHDNNDNKRTNASHSSARIMPTKLRVAKLPEPSTKEPFIAGLLNTNVTDCSKKSTMLQYMDKEGKLKQVDAKDEKPFEYEGYLRYNTKLIRWTDWFVELQRCTRVLMRQQLEWVQDPVVIKHDALSEQVTDYGSDNKGFTLDDFE